MNTFIEVLQTDSKKNFNKVYRVGTFKKNFAGLLLNILNRMYRKQTIVNDKHVVRNELISFPIIKDSYIASSNANDYH